MKNAVIIHGWGANSQSNWFPWLQSELEQKGWKVTVPDFPNSENPILEEWLDYFRSNVSIDQETVLIGHSLGVPFILRLLEQSKEKINPAPFSIEQRTMTSHAPGKNVLKRCWIKASFFVSGFERSLDIVEIESFVNKPFDWEKIKEACEQFTVINSDNDPYTPLSVGKELAKKLDGKLLVEHNAGHINDLNGTFAYPRLRDLILSS